MTGTTEFTSAAMSDRGLNKGRPQNEDAFLEMREFGIFAVADGVGGAQAGEVASQMAVEIVGEAFANKKSGTDAEETMRIALHRANDAIYQMSQDLPQLASMATTIVVLHLDGDVATIGHVGDSRIYRVDASGRLFRETDDHSVVEEEVRAGRMTAQQALNHPSRNVISRALGAEFSVEPDIKTMMVQPATTFLLCSDGITRHLTDAEIESLLAFGGEPAEVCARMKEICYGRGAEDNLTALVVSFPGERTPYASGDDDIEEVTLAGVREPVAEPDETAEQASVESERTAEPHSDIAEDLTTAAAAAAPSSPEPLPVSDDDSYLMEETQPVPKVREPARDAATKKPVSEPRLFETAGTYSETEGTGSGSSIRRALSAIGLLLAGILIGAAATYMLIPPNPPVVEAPVITEQKSNNVQLTSFEETRRLVDVDPVRYLNANAISPQEADDYFWLGRALLLTGKPVEAKRMFEIAKQKLPTWADHENLRTLTNELEMGLIVADNATAVEALSKNTNAAAVVNGNASNSLAPIR